MSLWDDIIERIRDFRKLGEDWDGQGGMKPLAGTIIRTIEIAETCRDQGCSPCCRVVPTPAGTILMEWQPPDGSCPEIEILAHDSAEWMHITPDGSVTHGGFDEGDELPSWTSCLS